MKKNFIAAYLASATMLLGACTENANPPTPNGKEEKANLTLSLNFEGVDAKPGTKTEAATGAIPPTSWNNIHNIQFFAYKTDNKSVAFSYTLEVSGSLSDITIPGIPTGNYTLVVLANVNSGRDNVTTYLDGGTTPVAWDQWNVRQKNAETELIIEHKSNTELGAEADNGLPNWYPSEFKTANKGYKEPSEIFRAVSEGLTIDAGSNTATLQLQRVVSLLRVRLDSRKFDATVDFTNKASILVYRLPNNMNVTTYMGDNASTATDMLSISGTETFKISSNPAGYTGGSIINEKFTKWREINVFPNAAGEPSATNEPAAINRKYFIVISAAAKAGHHLADGTSIAAGEPVYWSGLINEKFLANQIREVNLTLQTGGSKLPPTEVINDGSLIVTMSPPAPWNSNIVVTDIPM